MDSCVRLSGRQSPYDSWAERDGQHHRQTEWGEWKEWKEWKTWKDWKESEETRTTKGNDGKVSNSMPVPKHVKATDVNNCYRMLTVFPRSTLEDVTASYH